MTKRNRYRFITAVILVLITSIIIACYPQVKSELYKIKIIKTIDSIRVEEPSYSKDLTELYIRSSKERKIIVDAIKNSECRLWEEGASTPTLQYYISIENIHIYYGKRLMMIDDDKSFCFFLKEEDVAKIDGMIDNLEQK